MSVVIETTVGDLTVDLFLKERPRACQNFLKLCKLKYYNYNLFHTIQEGFIAQTGDPTGEGSGGESVWGLIEGPEKRFFEAEYQPKIRHNEPGLLSMVSLGDNLIGSQFFVTLGSDLTSLDGIHCVIGQVVEGLDVLRTINEAICDTTHRPYQDIRITHTVVLDDPFENPRGFREPSRSPSPSAERLRGGRIAADEDIDDTEGKTEQELHEMRLEREAKARATILEIVGDLPDAEIAPPENVLFVCKLNSVTTDDDLEIIFSRFGKIKGCEVIRDRKSGDSLQYAFIEFEDKKACENAYFKMDNVLIDDRRIHVDFSQSVSKLQWRGKGRGLIHKDGTKDNRLDFQNYNKPIRNENRNDSHRRNDRNEPRRDARRNDNRRYSRSPVRPSYSNDNRRRISPNRSERRRSPDRNRRRSPVRSRSRGRNGRQEYRNDRNRSDRRRSTDREENRNRRSSRSRSANRNRNGRPENRPTYRRSRDRDNGRRNVESNRSRSPINRRNRSQSPRHESRRNDNNRSVAERKDEKIDRKSRRSSSTEKEKSVHQERSKSSKKSKKSKSKHKKEKKEKKHKKKKSGKKHKKHSSSDSDSDSDSSTSSSD